MCTSSYEHLVQVLTRILDERPHDAVDVFETVSADVKHSVTDTAQAAIAHERGVQFDLDAHRAQPEEIAAAEIHQKLFVVCYVHCSV